MSQFGVDEVVCELYVEAGFGVRLAFGVEFGEYVFEVFEVVAEFECRIVGEELREECWVDLGDWRRVDGVGVEGYGEGGAGDVYGDVAVECQVPGAGCQRLYVECCVVGCGFCGVGVGGVLRCVEECRLRDMFFLCFVFLGLCVRLPARCFVPLLCEGGVGDGEVGEDTFGELPEFELVADLPQRGVVGLLQLQCVGVEGYGCVEAYGGELFGEESVVGV